MIKKIIAVAIGISLALCLSGCEFNSYVKDTAGNDGRLKIVYNDGAARIYVDDETGCQYFARDNCGTCLMVDENGAPLIYKQEG